VVNFGGHKKAAGIVVKKANMAEFMRSLENRSKELLASGGGEDRTQDDDVLDVELELPFDDVTFGTYKTVCRLKPFGISNSRPVFVTRGLIISDLYTMSDGAHLRVDLTSKDRPAENGKAVNALSAVGFGMGEYAGCFTVGDIVDVAYTLNEYTYRGNTTLSLHLEDIKPSLTGFAWEKCETMERLFRSGLGLGQIVKLNKELADRDVIPGTDDYGNVYKTLYSACGNKNSTADCVLLAKMININCRTDITPFCVRRCLEVFAEAGLIKLGSSGDRNVCFTFLPVKEKASLSSTDAYKRLVING